MIREQAWDQQARHEYEAARREAWESSDRQGERTDRFAEIIADAVQARRRWAMEVQAEAERVGYAANLKGWRKAQRTVAVSYKGEVITKPRTAGVRRSNDEGEQYATQTLFDLFTWDELAAKRKDYLQQVKTYSANVALIDRLLALRELAPSATNPGEAADALGTSLDEWLAA